MTTHDVLEYLGKATALFDDRLAGVRADQLGDSTPCTEWTVRDLAEHVTGGNRWAARLLDGGTAGEALELALAEGFAEDALADHRASAKAQLDAFASPGALERTCHHFVGDIRGDSFAWLRVADLVVHAWDVARATGGDEKLDDDLVLAVWAVNSPRANAIASSGLFGAGPSGTLPNEAPLQDRLLDLVGRRP